MMKQTGMIKFFCLFSQIFALCSCTNGTISDIYSVSIKKVVEVEISELSSVTSHATGVIVSEDGYVITCKHVVEEAVGNSLMTISVRSAFEEGFHTCSHVLSSYSDDVALLHCDISCEKQNVFNSFSSNYSIGENVYTLGNPNGLGLTFYSGIISSPPRLFETVSSSFEAIATSLPVSGGCSGGPLLNQKGALLGIISFVLYDSSGIQIQGLSFAVPISPILELISSVE